MRVEIESAHLNGILVLRHEVAEDARGFFMESYRTDLFAAIGLDVRFVQDNHSRSGKHVLRGLHFQWDPMMGKLVRVTRGAAYLVAVDVRKGSLHFGRWFAMELTEESRRQLWAPAGFARGFLALTEGVEVQYKCTGLYNPRAEGGILWSDPAIGIEWPVPDPVVSERDRTAPTLEEWAASPEAEYLRHDA